MKRTAILFLSMSTAVAFAQNERVAPKPEVGEVEAKIVKQDPRPDAAVFWSEDFSGGIPSTWSQNGTPSAAQWVYRGPSTTPNNTVGSQGAFNGTRGPITSTTASNGFVIFDSDYLDNGGDATNMGGGTAPAPHTGRLMTDTIDLSAHPDVELKFEAYARRFFSDWFVAFSTDGGATWTDTIEFFPDPPIGVNGETPTAELGLANVSSIIGGQSQVMLQFIYDGTPGNANGNGYYFWMIDDIELRDPPQNQMFFTAFQGAPAQDMIYNGDPLYAKYGIMDGDQIVSLEFDGNVFNYGSAAQTNVALEVEVWDASTMSQVTTLTSPSCATLPSGDTCDFSTLTTPTWTPPAPATDATDQYILVYKVISDSIPSSSTDATDTTSIFVADDLYSLDRNEISNYVGTNSANPELIAIGSRFSLENPESEDNHGDETLEAVSIALSSLTDSTADIEIAIYDTAGFTFAGGFPTTSTPIFRKIFSLDGSYPGTRALFPLGTEDSIYDNSTQTWSSAVRPIRIPTGTYFVMVNFFPNATDGVIRLANDASFGQNGTSSIMQLADGSWYPGFTSDIMEGPHIRLVTQAILDISVEENDKNDFSVYPNPTQGEGFIQFERAGAYDIKVFDMVGNMVHSDSKQLNANERVKVDFSHLSAGVYLINIEGEEISKTVKVTVR